MKRRKRAPDGRARAMAPRLSAAARGLRAALLLCAAARRVAPQATPWAYQPHSYYWLEFDDCETKDFASGPCAVPATFQYDSTDVQESCDMTAYGQAQGINLAVCDINLAGTERMAPHVISDQPLSDLLKHECHPAAAGCRQPAQVALQTRARPELGMRLRRQRRFRLRFRHPKRSSVGSALTVVSKPCKRSSQEVVLRRLRRFRP